MNINGILIIDKPEGWTSHDVVAKVRGALNKQRAALRSSQTPDTSTLGAQTTNSPTQEPQGKLRNAQQKPHNAQQKLRVGHGGTLDPMATGVLPIFIGRATKVAQFCENAEKEYIAGLRLGIVTETQDTTGAVISEQTPDSITAEKLSAALAQFKGRQLQTPPMYSAIKKNGKKLYELARKGIEVEREAREIEIKEIELLNAPTDAHSPVSAHNPADAHAPPTYYIRVLCSKGTYIRTLCHDIGQTLGCGAAMSYLRRTKAGVFAIDDVHKLDSAIAAIETQSPTAFEKLLLPADSVFSE